MPGKMMQFELPKGKSSIIKVIGVGGGGSNAVNHMFNEGIKGVDFVVCNTDEQALDNSPVPLKIQLGAGLTEGLGAGGDPEVGKNSALENIEQIKEILSKNTQMVFITAGMGGGTGTGGAPVIAQVARELGILTVGIVTIPFSNEGPKRMEQAEAGLNELRDRVDALLIICNDKLREMYGNLTLSSAFHQADNVLSTAARGIAEMVSVHGKINVDFKDVNTVMKDSGVAIMGTGVSEGDDRAVKAAELALASPLLNDNKITGARYVLLNITTGDQEPLLDEISDIGDYIQAEAGNTANVIMGVGSDQNLGEKLSVTLIAAGFESNPDLGFVANQEPEKVVIKLEDDIKPAPAVVHELTPEEDELEDTPEVKNEEQAEEIEFELKTKEPEAAEESSDLSDDLSSEAEAKDEASAKSEETAVTEVEEDKTVEEGPSTGSGQEEIKPPFTPDFTSPIEETSSQKEETKPEEEKEAKAEPDGSTEADAKVEAEAPESAEDIIAKKIAEAEAKEKEKKEESEEAVPEFKLIKKDESKSESELPADASDEASEEAKSEESKPLEFELNPKSRKQETKEAVENSDTPEVATTVASDLENPSEGAAEVEVPADPTLAKDRINKLKELSYKLKTPSGVSDLEKEPAYMRKNVELDDVPHSSESSVSRFTLSEDPDEEGTVTLKPNNPFLHDNVD